MTKKQFKFMRSLIDRLVKFNVSYELATYMAAQMCLETGFGTSKAFLEYNNLTGMSLAKVRFSLGLNVGKPYCGYACPSDSIIDYFFWLNYTGFTQRMALDPFLFLDHLINHGYNTRPKYKDNIISIVNLFKSFTYVS